MTELKNKAELKATLKAKTDELVSKDNELFANLSKEEITASKKERAKKFREENRDLLNKDVNDEKQTPKMNIVKNAQDKIDAKYIEFKNAVLNRDRLAFDTILNEIRALEKTYSDIEIPINPPKTIDDFLSLKEKEAMYKKCFLESSADPSREYGFFKNLNYIPSPEQIGFVFCELLKNPDTIGKAYDFVGPAKRLSHKNYIPITKEATLMLINRHSNVLLTGYGETGYGNENKNNRKKLIAHIANVKNIYYIDRDSYRSHLWLSEIIL